MDKVFIINELSQLKLLSDPFKLQLLQSFAEGTKTTKQVAEELGENITKLYRHVDALHNAGLLEIQKETRKRGTVERTFRAVARRFEADHALFSNEKGVTPEVRRAFKDLLRTTEEEIFSAIEHQQDHEEDAIYVRLRCKASPERIADLRKRLLEWVEAATVEEDDASIGTEEIGAFIAFYPVTSNDE